MTLKYKQIFSGVVVDRSFVNKYRELDVRLKASSSCQKLKVKDYGDFEVKRKDLFTQVIASRIVKSLAVDLKLVVEENNGRVGSSNSDAGTPDPEPDSLKGGNNGQGNVEEEKQGTIVLS